MATVHCLGETAAGMCDSLGGDPSAPACDPETWYLLWTVCAGSYRGWGCLPVERCPKIKTAVCLASPGAGLGAWE